MRRKWGLLPSSKHAGVAQVSNLPYLQLPVGRRGHVIAPADWKSATQQVANLRYVGDASLFGLNPSQVLVEPISQQREVFGHVWPAMALALPHDQFRL